MPTCHAAGTWVQWNQTYTMATSTMSTTGAASNAVVELWTNSSTSSTLPPTQKIWTAWNQKYVATSVTTSATGNNGWLLTAHDFQATSSVNPWPSWNEAYTASWRQLSSTVISAEEVAAQEQWRAARREESIRAEGERALARERAQTLLRDNLSAAQREELAAKGHFTITILEGEARRTYRIKKGRSRNVQQVDDRGRVLKTLCAHPMIACPDEDTMLAQKLWLETREREFLQVANHS